MILEKKQKQMIETKIREYYGLKPLRSKEWIDIIKDVMKSSTEKERELFTIKYKLNRNSLYIKKQLNYTERHCRRIVNDVIIKIALLAVQDGLMKYK